MVLLSSKNVRSVAWPTAMMTWSAGIHSLISPNCGQNWPCSSNTQVHSTRSMAAMLPSALITRPGPRDDRISIPSALASFSCQEWAGISSRPSRQTILTSAAPQRRAVMAASTATLPPPITTTLSPSLKSSPWAARLKNSVPRITSGT